MAVHSREDLKPEWIPRWYYIMKNNTSGKQYLGQTKQDINLYKGSGVYWKNHCKSNGGYNKKNIRVISSWWVEELELAELFLQEFEHKYNDYWVASNLLWANQIPEDTLDNPFFKNGAEISKVNNQKRIEDKTHPFLKENINGLMGNEFTSETVSLYNKEKLSNGTHQFLKENETESMRILRKNNFNGMNVYQLKSGLHPSQNIESCKEIGRKNKVHNLDRVDKGTHQFLNGFYAINKLGDSVKISKEDYKSQEGIKSEWEYVHPTSTEGKRRRGILNGSS